MTLTVVPDLRDPSLWYHIANRPSGRRGKAHERSEQCPAIVNPVHGVFAPASLFLWEEFAWRSGRIGSLLDMAEIICIWCNHLLELGVQWNEPSDAHYLQWLLDALSLGIVARGRLRRRASVVMRWYHFLASRNIGGSLLRSFAASISASPLDIANLEPRARFKAERGPKLKNGKRHVPHPEEVERVLDALASHENPFIAERDWSIGRTAYDTGLRVMGLEALTCSTVDALLRADRLIEANQRVEWMAQDRIAKVRLKTALADLVESGRQNLITDITEKNGKTRSVQFPITLVGRILEYIWGERRALLQKFGSAGYERSQRGLWLSSTTCEPLTNATIKDILRKRGFVAAEVKGSGHSLRAAFLTEYACVLIREAKRNFGDNYDAGAILLTLAEIAGHEDPKTLQHYLDEARIREALFDDRDFLRKI